MGYKVVKLIATVSEFGEYESREAVRLIDITLVTSALAYFGGLEITGIEDHPQPTEPNMDDYGFTIRMQTTDSNHYTFAFDDQILSTTYHNPPYEDQVSVTQQSYFGTYGNGYSTGKPNLGFIASLAFNYSGNYFWSDVGYERSLLVFVDDNNNIIGLSDIRMTDVSYQENTLFIDIPKSMIYMTSGILSSAGVGNIDGWIAGIHNSFPSGAFRRYGLSGSDGDAYQTSVLIKDPFNNFIKYEGSIDLTCFGMTEIYDNENHQERIKIDETNQKYIHVGNRNLFFPYDTYEEIEVDDD